LQLLDAGRPARAREILARHVEWLRRLKERKEWVRNRLVEAGQLDIDGRTPLGAVAFDPAWLLWNGGTVRLIAEAAAEQRDYSVLPILADAMEDAGCADVRILRHLRAPVAHCRSCWVMAGILGRIG
jgi:hypothetical protein